MRRILLSLIAALTIVSAASLAPTSGANAMTPSTAAGIMNAAEDLNLMEDVRYVCRHRYYSSRRVCFWRGGYGYYRPYRGYRRGFYRGYRRW